MKAIPHTLLAIILIVIGVFIGRQFCLPEIKNQDNVGATVENSFRRPERTSTATKTNAHDLEEKRDLAAYQKRFKEWSQRGAGQRRELERLSASELKAMLQDQTDLLGKGTMPENQARLSVVSAILGELYRREGVGAIEWADALKDPAARRSAMQSLLTLSVREDPDVALPWIRKFIEESGQNSVYANSFTSAAFSGAAERGADELIRVFEVFREKPRGDPFHLTKFPSGFDFAKLHSALTGKVELESIYGQWAAVDRDQAWTGVKQDLDSRGQPGGRYFGSVVLGAVAAHGEEAGLRWATERIAELPPKQRQFCLTNIDQQGKLTAEGIAIVSKILPQEDKKEFAQGLLRNMSAPGKAIAALQTLPRQQMLEVIYETRQRNAAIIKSDNPDSYQDSIRQAFNEFSSKLDLTEQEKTYIYGTEK